MLDHTTAHQRLKRSARRLVDRVVLPYVEAVRADVNQVVAAPGPEESSSDVPDQNIPSDFFHLANHELRTLELERVPKGGARVLSVGAQGRWYFDWFERSYGAVQEHIGIEAFEPMPEDLPEYVRWVPETADHMDMVAASSVDLVFAGQTSEHLWADELAGFLLEARRVLRPGGILALDSPNRLVTEHLRWSHGGHTIELSASEMEHLLVLAGFEVLTTAGIWLSVLDGRHLALEEGVEDPAVLVRRVACGRDAPDECFVWWINAARSDAEVDPERLRAAVAGLFDDHWDTRVCRGLFPHPGARTLALVPGASGRLASTLPFPLHGGRWSVAATLRSGSWSDARGFRLRVVAPGDHVVHELRLEDAAVEGAVATWHLEQPYLLFALTIEVLAERVVAPCELVLPLQVRHLS